jgi:hypothetical protein
VKKQIEILTAQAKTYMMMAKIMKAKGYTDSSRSYLNSGKQCCQMAIKLKAEWDADRTDFFEMPLAA